jgi:hypothetical protein
MLIPNNRKNVSGLILNRRYQSGSVIITAFPSFTAWGEHRGARTTPASGGCIVLCQGRCELPSRCKACQ